MDRRVLWAFIAVMICIVIVEIGVIYYKKRALSKNSQMVSADPKFASELESYVKKNLKHEFLPDKFDYHSYTSSIQGPKSQLLSYTNIETQWNKKGVNIEAFLAYDNRAGTLQRTYMFIKPSKERLKSNNKQYAQDITKRYLNMQNNTYTYKCRSVKTEEICEYFMSSTNGSKYGNGLYLSQAVEEIGNILVFSCSFPPKSIASEIATSCFSSNVN